MTPSLSQTVMKLYDNSLKSENALGMRSRHFPMWFYILFCLVSHGLQLCQISCLYPEKFNQA